MLTRDEELDGGGVETTKDAEDILNLGIDDCNEARECDEDRRAQEVPIGNS